MHYANQEGFNGAGYLISYSCGSMIVTILVWICRYLYNIYTLDGNVAKAYDALPSFHLRQIGVSGFVTGFIYSIGNFCSIVAVAELGQGVGYSFIQSSMLISGLWGISFGEIQGSEKIAKWMTSSVITIIGIMWLSYEHES